MLEKKEQQIRSYSQYKDSGVEWLGEIPEHWGVKPLFAVMKERQIKNFKNKVQNVLSLSYGKIITRDVTNNFGLLPESFETYQIVDNGNIILRLTDLQNDKRSLRVGLVQEYGIITSAYTCLDSKEDVYPKYAYYLLHNYDLWKVFYNFGNGVRQTMNFDDLKRLPFLLPPLPEQRAIADYLDRETARIDALIGKYQRLVELLEEKRQSFVIQSVTKGLDLTAPMVDTTEWFRKIPSTWKVSKLKYIKSSEPNSFVDGPFGSNLKSEHFDPAGDVYVIESEFATTGKLSTEELKKISMSHFETIKRSETKANDIIIAKIGARFGLNSILPNLDRLAVVSGNSLKLSVNTDMHNLKFIHYSLLCLKWVGAIGLIANFTAQPALSLGGMNSLSLAIPPIMEQEKIVEYIEAQYKNIDCLVNRIRLIVEKLIELRISIISSAVTGKIDVTQNQA